MRKYDKQTYKHRDLIMLEDTHCLRYVFELILRTFKFCWDGDGASLFWDKQKRTEYFIEIYDEEIKYTFVSKFQIKKHDEYNG